MRYRGLNVGSFFLGEKEGGLEFTDEDEELLLLFASQAAIAIANARTYRDEQRARVGLETLVETEGYAADWTVEQLREPAQRIADRIDDMMNAGANKDQTFNDAAVDHAT